MRGIGMLFNPQGQLIINVRQVCVLHGDILKGIKLCSCLSFKLCHLSDTPHTGEELSDQAHRLPLPALRGRWENPNAPNLQSPRGSLALPDRVAAGAKAVLRLPPLPETERATDH